MAFLIAEFGRATGSPPIMVGAGCRTQKVTIGSEADSSLQARAGENVVALYAEAQCWVEIGASPTAADPGAGTSDSHFMAEGDRREFLIQENQTVSVVTG